MLNLAVVIGSLAKPTQVRTLPSGLSLACFDLQVVRSDEAVDTVPVAFFDAPSHVAHWQTGEVLLAIGRVRRRFFRIGGITQSRTEMVADRVLALGDRDNVLAALARAGSTIADALEDILPR